jgi:hemolysin activation/secretion protein
VASGRIAWERRLRSRGTVLSGSLDGSITSDGAPAHELFLIGGRQTLPGFTYRSFVGDRMALIRIEASQAVFAPWLYLRAFGAAGAVDMRGTLPSSWSGTTTDGIAASAGVGVAVGWDVLQLDLGRGLRQGGEWELIFSAHKRFWPWL